MARPYRSQVRPSATAIAAVLCAALGSAILLAIGWQWLGAYGDILFAGTIVRGLLIGGLLTWLYRKTRFSRPRAAATVAVLATLLAIIGADFVDHRHQRAEMLEDAAELLLFSTGAGTDAAEVQAEYDRTEESLTFLNYLRRYYGFEGQASDGAAALWGPWAGLALYGIEIAAALAMATLYPIGQASEPVCPECGRWQQEALLGAAAHGTSEQFIAHLLHSEMDAALAALEAPDTREHLEMSLARCPSGHNQHKGGVLRVRDRVYGSGDRNLLLRDRADLIIDQGESDAIAKRLSEWA